MVENGIKRESRKIYIIEDDGVKAGHLYMIPDGDCFDLSSAVLQKYQGKGYAKKAISLGLEIGRQNGFQKMKGQIREDNIASMKVYTSCGVKVTEDYNMVYIPKLGKEVKMYIVEKELN